MLRHPVVNFLDTTVPLQSSRTAVTSVPFVVATARRRMQMRRRYIRRTQDEAWRNSAAVETRREIDLLYGWWTGITGDDESRTSLRDAKLILLSVSAQLSHYRADTFATLSIYSVRDGDRLS